MTADAAIPLRNRFLNAMSRVACTVTIVTTDGLAGEAGVTVSAMSSVSADGEKPVLLVCINSASASAATIIANGVFCVNVLADDQSYVSDVFASMRKPAGEGKFSCASWARLDTGAPALAGALASFDCRLLDSKRVGTHEVLFGVVENVVTAELGSPLIYSARAYGTALRFHDAPDLDAPQEDASVTLKLGCYQTFAPSLLPELVARVQRHSSGIRLKLMEGDQRLMLESLRSGQIELALLYDFGLGTDVASTPVGEFSPYVLLPQEHPLASRATVDLTDLTEEKLVLLDLNPSRDYFLSLFSEAGLKPRIGHRTSSLETVRGLVGQGLGYSLLGTKPWGDQTYDGHRLAIRPLAKPASPSRIVLGQMAGRPLTRAAEIFKSECLSLFKS